MSEKLYAIAQANIEKSIEEVFKPENSGSYLKVLSRFRQYDYQNQLLILKQDPEARYILGVDAAKRAGMEVTSDTPKIMLLYPQITKDQAGKYKAETQVVAGISVSREIREPQATVSSVVNAARSASGFTITLGEKGDFPDKKNYYADTQARRLVIREGLEGVDFAREVISCYVEFRFARKEKNDYYTVMEQFVRLAVQDVLGVLPQKPYYPNLAAIVMQEAPADVKRAFLDELSDVSRQIADELTNPTLSFTEIAILNAVMNTDKADELTVLIKTVAETLDPGDIRDAAFGLSEKCLHLSDEALSGLYERVRRRSLTAAEPVYISYRAEE